MTHPIRVRTDKVRKVGSKSDDRVWNDIITTQMISSLPKFYYFDDFNQYIKIGDTKKYKRYIGKSIVGSHIEIYT